MRMMEFFLSLGFRYFPKSIILNDWWWRKEGLKSENEREGSHTITKFLNQINLTKISVIFLLKKKYKNDGRKFGKKRSRMAQHINQLLLLLEESWKKVLCPYRFHLKRTCVYICVLQNKNLLWMQKWWDILIIILSSEENGSVYCLGRDYMLQSNNYCVHILHGWREQKQFFC
jgi:hypothetical protein